MPNTTRLCADGSPNGSAVIAAACQATSSCSSSAVTAFSSSETTCMTAPLHFSGAICVAPQRKANSRAPGSCCVCYGAVLRRDNCRSLEAVGRAWLQGRCGSACSANAPASCSGSSGPPPSAAAAAAAVPPWASSVAAAAATALRRCFREAQCRS